MMGRRIESLLTWLSELTFPQFISLLGVANVVMYAGSWAGISVLQRHFAQSTMNAQAALVSRRDVLLSLLILSINVAVGIPGWWLWKHGYIVLVERPFPAAMLDGAMMFVYFDFCMYSLHRVMHVSWLYDVIHRRHHDHTNVSGISLYVMSPVEAAGFGMLLILFLLCRPCDVNALLVFLFFNWLYGTIGHSALPISGGLLSWFVGDAAFHHRHHTEQRCNYGFFTGVWDRLWGTFV
jgi:sterol desaturase/sphingolipid hydroxylase (fatty acid hydroxylase superfamily)